VSSPEPALFRAFPELRSRLPCHPIVTGPTPVAALPLAGLPEGALFVKRDERSSPRYGGNKPRKLEWILGAALARGSRRLVTTGGLGTHHGLATCILARDAGLRTTVVMVKQPVTAEVQHSLLLHAAWGAQLYWGRNVPGTAVQVLRALAAATARGERPLLVPPGGSSADGQLGFVSAGLELAEQVRAGELPEPAELYVSVGTGGTHAGLVAGLALARLRTRVVGVLVTDILPPSPRKLARMARSAVERLRRWLPRLPQLAISDRDFDFVRSQLGAGYGAATDAASAAVATAAGHGLRLETTYTGKCLAALIERTRRGAGPRGPILFWNTFNAVDVEASAPAPLDPGALPPSLRRFLAQGQAERAASRRRAEP
jgi:D-cysteine desulfhydrase